MPLQTRRSKPGDAFRDCPDCVEMVVIPPGGYDMGSRAKPTEQPVHRVNIRTPFAIGRRLVTFGEWDACVAAGGCKYAPPDADPGAQIVRSRTSVGTTPRSSRRGCPGPPANRIAFQARRSGSMPPAPARRPPSGGRRRRDGERAVRRMRRQGKRQIGAGRLLSGQPVRPRRHERDAAEWVEDRRNSGSDRGAPTDGSPWTSGDCSLRVLRGGSFLDKAAALRSSARFRYDHDVRYYANGFRVARDIPSPSFGSPPRRRPLRPRRPPRRRALRQARPLRRAAPRRPPFRSRKRCEGRRTTSSPRPVWRARHKRTLVIDPLIDGASGRARLRPSPKRS